MQAGPAYGERKPLSHLVMDSSKIRIDSRYEYPHTCFS